MQIAKLTRLSELVSVPMAAVNYETARGPFVCSVGQPNTTNALVRELNFTEVAFDQLEPCLACGNNVLVHGIFPLILPLVKKYPGQIVIMWHAGWAGSDLIGENNALIGALHLAARNEIRLIWLEDRDVLPPGAVRVPPVWSATEMLGQAQRCRIEREPRSVLVVPHSEYTTAAKNSLAAIIGCAGLGAKLYIGLDALNGVAGRVSIVDPLLEGVECEYFDRLDREKLFELTARVSIVVHPSFSEVWPGLPLEAVYSGTAVVGSDAIPWFADLPSWAQDLCCVRPALASKKIQALVGHLLDNSADRERLVLAQRATLNRLQPARIDAARTALAAAGLAPKKPRVCRKVDGKPRVLLVSDVRGWAFDRNNRDMAHYLRDEFAFDFWYIADWDRDKSICPDFDSYSSIFIPYHRWPIEHLLPLDRTLSSLRAAWLWPERMEPPSDNDYKFVNRYRGFHVVTQKNFDELHGHCPRVVYLTNPVNTERFSKPTALSGVVASWNGNAKHINANGVDVKGFYPIIEPACKAADVPLVFAEYHTARLAAEEMPGFYRHGNVAVCMSLYEGASNSVMESMAAGQAVISTDAGNIVEIRDSQIKHFGESGIEIIPRTVQDLTAALMRLRMHPKRIKRMGELNRTEIFERWSWRVWADRYADFLRMAE